jgi:hemerythrin superfamily protein
MKATSLLDDQHRTVEALFEKLERGQGDPGATLQTLAKTLLAHMAIEQDIFYPAIQNVDVERVSESYEEHALTEVALERLLATDRGDPAFKARVTTLKSLLQHHVIEEEEELFPLIEESLSEDALIQLGKVMRNRFNELLEVGATAASKRTVSKTLADVARKALSPGAGARRSPKKERKKDKTLFV